MRLSTEVPSRNDSFSGSRRAKTSRVLAQLLIISMANSVARSHILVGAHPPCNHSAFPGNFLVRAFGASALANGAGPYAKLSSTPGNASSFSARCGVFPT
jgi:hypothetical protein